MTLPIAPLEWSSVWAAETSVEEWIVRPIVPAHRQVAIYSPAKVGKSLLALDVAASTATGRPTLGRPVGEPRGVVYLDFEMTLADVRERLVDLGYGPSDDLSRLAYYQLPLLPPLDTPRGGETLEELLVEHQAELVVLDTMARVVDGDENDSGTYRDFYANCGVRLKRLGVSLVRLDHAGKDPTRGQRGSSSKADDVDVVFRLSVTGDRVVLTRTHSRVPWVPAEVALRRETEPLLRHVLEDAGEPSGVDETVRLLEELEVALDATLTAAEAALRDAGVGRRRQLIAAALRTRRERQRGSAKAGTVARKPPNAVNGNRSGTDLPKRAKTQVKPGSAVPGTAGNRSASVPVPGSPPKGGTETDTTSGTDEKQAVESTDACVCGHGAGWHQPPGSGRCPIPRCGCKSFRKV